MNRHRDRRTVHPAVSDLDCASTPHSKVSSAAFPLNRTTWQHRGPHEYRIGGEAHGYARLHNSVQYPATRRPSPGTPCHSNGCRGEALPEHSPIVDGKPSDLS